MPRGSLMRARTDKMRIGLELSGIYGYGNRAMGLDVELISSQLQLYRGKRAPLLSFYDFCSLKSYRTVMRL